MARRWVATRIVDEAGNALGGSGYELRVYTDEALTTLATVYSNIAAGASLTQPLTPNAGGQTTLTANTLTTDTVITVADVSTFAVGNRIRISNGTDTRWRTITAINAGAKQLTLDSAIGVAFSTSNTTVNGRDMIGLVAFGVDDANDYYAAVKHVATGNTVHFFHIPIRAPSSPIDVQEEGTLVNNRVKINFIGASVTAADDAPNSRVNVTITGLQADGSVGAPSIGYVSETTLGWYRAGTREMVATANANLLDLLGAVSAVNYVRIQNAATANAPTIKALGSDANVALSITTKGSGDLNFYHTDGGAVLAVLRAITSSVNYIGIAPNTATNPPIIDSRGTDATIDVHIDGKGATSAIRLRPGGNFGLTVIGVASAVNYLVVYNAATGSKPVIEALGNDANISINVLPKGTGELQWAGVRVERGIIALKTADEAVNNSTTLQNDDHLTLSLEAGATYAIQVFLWIDGPAGAGFKWDWTIPSGMVGVMTGTMIAGNDTAAVSNVNDITHETFTTALGGTTGGFNFGGASSQGKLALRGTIYAPNAGTLQLRWAQQAATAGNTTVKARSYVVVQKLS